MTQKKKILTDIIENASDMDNEHLNELTTEQVVNDERNNPVSDRDEDCCLRRLLTEGKRVESTSSLVDINQRPDYFDLERFKRAQKTCQKYYTNLSMASSTGLMILLQIESILIPLLRTGKSRTVEHLYDRYTATAKFIRQYYESDFYEPDTEGRRAINLVRAMHQRIYKYMNDPAASGASQLDWIPPDSKDGGELLVNQHDMAITQFAFIGLFLLYPERCAAYHITRDELSDVAYYWRLISYYLGIEDRFNIFAQCDDLNKQTELMRKLLEHVNKLRSEPQYDTGRRMSEGFMLAFGDFLTESSFNILNHWWSPCFSLSGDHELKPYTLGDRWKLIFFLFYFKILFRSELFLSYMNKVYKRKFDKFCADGEKIKPKLAEKYKNITYEL